MVRIVQLASRGLEVPGEFWECGVYRGYTSKLLAGLLRENQPRTLRLFDTFHGRPPIGPKDGTVGHSDFNGGKLEQEVRLAVPDEFASIHKGLIPETFKGLEDSKIAFAFVDLDLYQSTKDALEFILPRLQKGGLVVIHDYNESRCWPGVKIAVDELVSPNYRLSIQGEYAIVEEVMADEKKKTIENKAVRIIVPTGAMAGKPGR